MLTVLEILIILANIPVLIWALLPVKRVPRFLDFMPLAAVIFLILHLFIDHEPMRMRMIPLYILTITLFLISLPRIFRHNPDLPQRRIFAVVGRLFGILVLGFSILVPTVLFPFHSLPKPTGNFKVGTVVSDFTDQNRLEPYSKEEGEPRKIAVQFWYPVDNTVSQSQENISGAPVSTSQPTYPVLIFSHGAFGVRNSNFSTFNELASHGYIVASIDHTYHAFYTSFANGKSVPINMKFLNEAIAVQNNDLSIEETFEITQDWLNVRTSDIELVIDRLKSGELGVEGELLKGHMDLNQIGLFGHSLGGAASAEVAREREDVKAAMVLDGTMIGDITGINTDHKEMITEESFTKPLMLMYSSLFQDPEAKATSYLPNINAYNHATSAAYSLSIKGSGHLNFTDLPRISPFLAQKLGVGPVDSLEGIQIVNAYILAFFDQHLKGQPSGLLEGTEGYEAVEFEKRIPTGIED